MSTGSSDGFGAAILRGVPTGIVTIDRACNVLFWNGFMERNSGIEASAMSGRNLFDAFPELPRAWLQRKIENVFAVGHFSFVSWRQRPFLFRFPHNRPITGGVAFMHQDITLLPLRDEDGAIRAVCITLVDATDAALMQQETERSAALLREAMIELERLSLRDGLTGIYNRRSLDRRLASEFEAFAGSGKPFSIALFDLDFFKKVNDRFGHLGGDEVLRVVARRLGAIVREADMFGRYGGEEFMVIMPGTTRAEGLIAAERFRAALAGAPIVFDGQSIPQTISVGVCEAAVGMRDGLELVHHADAVLYGCKAAGRNCVRAHVPEPRAA